MSFQSPLINVMQQAVRKAARGLVRDFGEVEGLQVSRKGPGDFVSIADKKSEQTLMEALATARPKYGFLSEESKPITGEDPERRWIIDPLDGTTNFLHGIPFFAISVALEERGQITAAVVAAPALDEIFHAEKGQGAYLNNHRIRVSGRREVDDAVLATGIPHMGRSHGDEFLSDLAYISPRVSGVRRFGAAALDLAYVAAGRCDGFWERGLAPWDIAGGILLVKEAGGYVSTTGDKDNMMETGDILATNGHLQGKILRMLKESRSARVKVAAGD